VDNKILQEEVVETKAEVLESTENPQTMEKEEIQEEETMEYPKEDEEDMVKEDEKEMEKEEDEEETDMVEEEDKEETDMVEEEEEEEEMKKDKDKDYYEEGVEIDEEENMTATETQIESQEESSSTALDHSERAELEAFRRERKEGLVRSFEDDLSVEFLENLTKELNNYSFDELEVILSKEFTRVNRETKKSKPNAFIYKPEIKSSSKSDIDVVKELIQKYK
jgi:hypothetical protein